MYVGQIYLTLLIRHIHNAEYVMNLVLLIRNLK